MTFKTFNEIRDIPTGYFLEDGEAGFISVIIPEQRDNFITNPVMYDSDNNGLPDNYFTSLPNGTSSIRKIEGQGPYWRYYYEIDGYLESHIVRSPASSIPFSEAITGSIFAKHSSGFPVKFRVVIRGNAVSDVTNTSVVLVTSEAFTSTIQWEQYAITYTPSTPVENITVELQFIDDGDVVEDTLDVAGFQLEIGTYGTNFIHGYLGDGYEWLGVELSSESRRTEDAICQGREVNLKDLGLRLKSINGLGIPDEFELNSQARAFQFGSVFKCRSIESRDVTMEFVLYACSLKDLLCARNKIGATIFDINGPRCFKWQPLDCAVPCPCVEFQLVYESGFSFGYNTHFGEEIDLNFQSFDIEIKSCEQKCFELEIGELNDDPSFMIGVDGLGNSVILPDFPEQIDIFNFNDAVISPYDNMLYASATVVRPGSQRASILARYNGYTWESLARTNTAVSPFQEISGIFAAGKYLFVGVNNQGQLTGNSPDDSLTGTSGNGFALIDLTTGQIDNSISINNGSTFAADGTLTPREVVAFEQVGNIVYIGGNFTGYNGLTSRDIFGFNMQNGLPFQAAGFFPGLTGNRGGIRDILYVKETDQLWIAGDFHNSTVSLFDEYRAIYGFDFNTNQPIDIKVVNSGGEYFDTVFNGTQIGRIEALAYYDGHVVFGGAFDSSVEDLVDTPANNILNFGYIDGHLKRFDSALAIPAYTAGQVAVNDLTVCDSRLHIAGNFLNYGHMSDATFQADGSSCGTLELISNGNLESSTFTLPEVQHGAGGTLDSCNVKTIICGSNRIGLERIYFNRLQPGLGSFLSRFETSIPTPHYLCSTYLPTRPRFYVKGPAHIYEIVNKLNNTGLYLDYVLDEDEILEFRNDSIPFKIESSLYGDVTNQITNNSSNLILEPGELNSIVVRINRRNASDDGEAWFCYTPSSLAAENLQCSCPD